jgi:hypothetical protein
MQINLSDTTHTLRLETSVVGAIHYHIGYVDITNTDISNPLDEEGIITTATTTIISSAPSTLTTRKIQHLNVYNNGVSNTVTVKKDVLGTEYILLTATLQNKETLRIVSDKVEVLDASGRLKAQNAGDSEIKGRNVSLFKVGTAPEGAGNYYFFGKDAGTPGAWIPGTPGVNGRNTNGTTSLDAGCISVGNPSTGSWYLRDFNISASQAGAFMLADVLWVNSGLSVTTTTAQAIVQPTLPIRDVLGTSNGVGVSIGILVTTATTNAAVVNTITVSYTNSAGVAGRTGTLSFPATAVIGTFKPINLAQGDFGVRSIQSITLGTTLTAGAISLVCYTPLGTCPVTLANVGSIAFQRKLDLSIYDGHCILPFWIASSTTAVNITGTVYFINK